MINDDVYFWRQLRLRHYSSSHKLFTEISTIFHRRMRGVNVVVVGVILVFRIEFLIFKFHTEISQSKTFNNLGDNSDHVIFFS